MYKLDIAPSMIEEKRYEVRSKLNNKLYAIGSSIREKDQGLYNIVEDAFSVFYAIRSKLAEKNGGPDGVKFSNIYSSYISSEYVLDDLVQSDSQPSEKNYFDDTSESFEGHSTDIERRILTILSKSLKHENTSKSPREMIVDYFSWLSTQAQNAAAKPDMSKFVKPAYKEKITVLGKSFKGFEYQRDITLSDGERLSWDSIGGYEEVKQQFLKYCFFLEKADTITAKYGKLSNFIPKGILLVGPPGTGKTLFANTLCHEAGIDFYAFDQADVGSSYVNKTAKNLRELINKASEPVSKKFKSSSIIFIDELDSIAKKRKEGGSDEDAKVVNTLNAHMRGSKSVDGVFFIGATNREDIMDPALTSSGRFSKRIEIGFPDDEALEQIYLIHLNRINSSIQSGQAFSPNIDLGKIVKKSSNNSLFSKLHSQYHMDNDICQSGFTGAVVEEILNRAYQERVFETESESKEYKPISQDELLAEIDRFRQERSFGNGKNETSN